MTSNIRQISNINPIPYTKGTNTSILSVLTTSGTTYITDNEDFKEGANSISVSFNNGVTENYVDLILQSNIASGSLVGFWMYVNYLEQVNVSNIKFELYNSTFKQAYYYWWGQAMSDVDYQGNPIGLFPGGWQYIKLHNYSTNPINRIRIIVKSNLEVSTPIATFKVDNFISIGRKIRPVITFNVDSAYANADNYDGAGSSVYDWFTELNLPYTITGVLPSSNFNRSRIFNQVQNKICEIGCYSGEVSGITNAISSETIMPLIDQLKAKKITDGYGSMKVIGGQFMKVTELLLQCFNDANSKVFRGGLSAGRSHGQQNIYGYNGTGILQLSPTSLGAGATTESARTYAKNDAKAFIDYVVQYGSVGIFFAHDFSE